ncbi:MAG: glycosyltransferase [Lachnospiraceae bacterium]|nr:glycosyltransferase [Lachnospiraceae bacterium]
MDKIAVLIPCYNEAKTIRKVVTDFRTSLPEAVIYVYDNNSIDGTADIAREAGAIVRHEYKQGKGNVIRRMFREVEAEVYLMVDGDDTYPAEAAPEMVRLVQEKNSDMVVGDRLSSTYFIENKRPFHNFGNSIVRWSINQLFHTSIKDIMTGYRAFSYQFVKSFPVLSKGFEIETEMSIHAVNYNMQVDNVVIEYRDRPEGSVSKLNTFRDGFKVIKTIIRLYKDYKPFGFFNMIAGILLALSIGFFISVLMEYMKTGLVAKFPTLITCGFVMIMAIVMFVAGIILSTLRVKDRQDFEYKMEQVQYMYYRVAVQSEVTYDIEIQQIVNNYNKNRINMLHGDLKRCARNIH